MQWKQRTTIYTRLMTAFLCVALLAACGTKPLPNPNGGAAAPVEHQTWAEAPAMAIDQNKSYKAVIKTSKGEFTMELFASKAPLAVNNFVFLAKEKYYDGVTFHRIIQSFVIQTGDPLGDGTGGPGYSFKDELNTGLKYEVGTVAMANSGRDTNGSQFFICTGPDAVTILNGNPNYTIFGKIVSGMEVVQDIAATPVRADYRGELSSPIEKVTIDSIEIIES